MAFDPVTLILTLAINAASYGVQERAKRKARKKAEFEGGTAVPEVGSPQTLPVVYGRAKLKGIVAGIRLTRSFDTGHIPQHHTDINPRPSAGIGVREVEDAGGAVWIGTSDRSGRRNIKYTPSTHNFRIENRSGDGDSVSIHYSDYPLVQNFEPGSRNDFLYVQYAIAQGGIHRIRNIDIDGVPFDDESIGYGQRMHVYPEGGGFDYTGDDHGTVGDPMASKNGFPNTNLFTGCAYATGAFRYDFDAPQYTGIPEAEFYVEGRLVRTVVRSGSVGAYTYALSSSKTYSNNLAWVLLDYLIGDHGGRVPLSDIDLESFYEAAQVCARAVGRNGYVEFEVPGVSYLYARSSSPTLAVNQKPTGSAIPTFALNGVTWSSAEPAYSLALPYLWQTHRSGTASWSEPVPVDPFHREGRQWRVPISSECPTQPLNRDTDNVANGYIHFSGVVDGELFADAQELAFDMTLRHASGSQRTFTVVFEEADLVTVGSIKALPYRWFRARSSAPGTSRTGFTTIYDGGFETEDYGPSVLGSVPGLDPTSFERYQQRRSAVATGIDIQSSPSGNQYFPPNAEAMTPLRIHRYKSSVGEDEGLIQGEFNGVLNSDDPVWDNVEKILSAMQKARLVWSHAGWTLKVTYPRSEKEQTDLHRHQFVEDAKFATIKDRTDGGGTKLHPVEITRDEPFIVNPPSLESRLNQGSGGFPNENNDYNPDSVDWPRYAPTSEASSPYRTYLAEDNERVLSASLRADGISDPFHMRARVEQQVRTSRSEFAYSFSATMDAMELEIGDVVPITAFGYDEDIEIDNLELVDWTYVKITGHTLRWQDLAWNVSDDFAGSKPSYTNFAVEPPTLEIGDFDENRRVVPLTITPPDSATSGASAFIVEQYVGTIPDGADHDALLWEPIIETRLTMHPAAVGLGAETYNFRAKTVSAGGRVSAPSGVVSVAIAAHPGFDGEPALPGFGATQAMAMQAPTRAAIDVRQEWYAGYGSGGSTSATTLPHLRNVVRLALSHIQTRGGVSVPDREVFYENVLEPGLDRVTLYWSRSQWAEFTIDSRVDTTATSYTEFGVTFLEGDGLTGNIPAGAMTLVFSRLNNPLRIIDVFAHTTGAESNPGEVTVGVATADIDVLPDGWTQDVSTLSGTVYTTRAQVVTRLETGSVVVSAAQWDSRYPSITPGSPGENSPYFRQPVQEVPVQADGVDILNATSFDPDPAQAVMTFVQSDGTTMDVTITGDVSATGVAGTLDNTDFEIV